MLKKKRKSGIWALKPYKIGHFKHSEGPRRGLKKNVQDQFFFFNQAVWRLKIEESSGPPQRNLQTEPLGRPAQQVGGARFEDSFGEALWILQSSIFKQPDQKKKINIKKIFWSSPGTLRMPEMYYFVRFSAKIPDFLYFFSKTSYFVGCCIDTIGFCVFVKPEMVESRTSWGPKPWIGSHHYFLWPKSAIMHTVLYCIPNYYRFILWYGMLCVMFHGILYDTMPYQSRYSRI